MFLSASRILPKARHPLLRIVPYHLRTMATATLNEPTLALLKRAYPTITLDPSTPPSKANAAIFPSTHYTDAEKASTDQWVIESWHIGSASEDAAKAAARLSSLNTHLASRTTLLGAKPSVADVALYARLTPLLKSWSAAERTGEQGLHHVVRWLDFVQCGEPFGLRLGADGVAVDVDDVRVPVRPVDTKERKRREKEAAAAAAAAAAAGGEAGAQQAGKKSVGDVVAEAVGAAVAAPTKDGADQKDAKKKDKKEKQAKPQKAPPAPEKPLSPALIDLRVGLILKAVQHPNADSLYVSTVVVGDPPGTENTSEYEGQVVRTVCSGLNGLVPLEEMQNRKIVAVCNLKPVTMRGVKSCAMVLAASPRVTEAEDDHKGPVELVNPPADSKAGERVYFEGWEGEPEAVLNPKKKIWETFQPGFTTTEGLEVGFEVDAVPQLKEQGKSGLAKLRTKEGLCSVKTLKGATVR